jgi:hypothetical protein
MLPLLSIAAQTGAAEGAVGAADGAETNPGQELPAQYFPLALLLEVLDTKGMGVHYWQPDWPPEIPSDAFKLPEGASSLTLDAGGPLLQLSRNSDGSVAAFPFLINRALAQINIQYDEEKRIKTIDAAGLWLFEALEYPGKEPPSLFRVLRNGEYSFVLLQRGLKSVSESWYDEKGAALGFYEYSVSENPGRRIRMIRRIDGSGEEETERFFDSNFLMTGIKGPEGNCSVNYYRNNYPRYWESLPVFSETPEADMDADAEAARRYYTLQWDERGFLVRLYSAAPFGTGNDSRYEYSLDEKGAWIERRELKMVRAFGRLVSSPGGVLRRAIVYGQKE